MLDILPTVCYLTPMNNANPIPDKKFVFEISIVAREYCPKTCEQDFGNKECYNSDFPNSVYAHEILGQAFKDASCFCRFMMMEMIAKHKTEPDTWEDGDKQMYQAYEARAKMWDEKSREAICVRTEAVQ